jgi:hypothetical protein
MEVAPMAEYTKLGEHNEIISKDLILAMLIGLGVIAGDFILRHLPRL